jgi:hypothetical protein
VSRRGCRLRSVIHRAAVGTRAVGTLALALEFGDGLVDSAGVAADDPAQFLPVEAQNSYTDKCSDILLNAVSGTANSTFNGLLQTSGVLTQSASGLEPLDALSMGFVAIRNGSAKADPDLVIMSPNTLGALRRLKKRRRKLFARVAFWAFESVGLRAARRPRD